MGSGEVILAVAADLLESQAIISQQDPFPAG